MERVQSPPPRAELARRAALLVPVLREQATWSEANRRLSDEAVAAMTDAGVFRMRVPERFGGYEADAATLVDVGIEIGRGDGSAGFNVAAWWIMTWQVGLFPDEVQEEVFADPDVRICGTLAPTGTAVAKDGGIVVNGQWNFNSGAAHSTWKLLTAVLPTADGGAEPVSGLVPMSELTLIDDWDVAGLRGTGSIKATAENLFIPANRFLPISALLRQEYPTKLNAHRPSYRVPMVASVGVATVGKIVGLARAAVELFLDRIETRTITNTMYERQGDAALTHLQTAEASLLTDEAEYHARRIAAMVDEKGLADEPWTLRERAYARVCVGRACQLAGQAIDLLAGASGANSIYSSDPVQRIRRDIQAINIHSVNLPSTNMELYGRILCGREPNTFFV
jgi:alkylation response protein AidB-like acyl-CoA dehydrogenase